MGKKKAKQKSGNQNNRVLLPGEQVLPTPEFAARNVLEKIKTDQKGFALRVQDKRPIDRYYRLYCIDLDRGLGEQYRRGINQDQFRSADRLANNYERCFPKTAMNLNDVRVQTSINVALYPAEAMMHAVHIHTRTMRELSRMSQDIVEEICCKESNLLDYEQAKGWRKGYGMIRLREALDELNEAFRTAFQSNSQ